jgi:formate dehydrogenase subunit beta
MIIQKIQDHARDLLKSHNVHCVIGYEIGTRGRTRPAFISRENDVDQLVWNQNCTHNLTVYLTEKLQESSDKVAIIVKPCDSKTINLLLAENKFKRDQIEVIGLNCNGIFDGSGFANGHGKELQTRCRTCKNRTPVIYDVLFGENQEDILRDDIVYEDQLKIFEEMIPAEREDYWLDEFDRCILCYACRQACPMCDCPTCLFERDDSLWVSPSNRLDEKRAFHLGRAFHLAGRCIGCNECERVCPMNIPLSLINRKLSQDMEEMFNYRAGIQLEPSPIVTILDEKEEQ